MYRLGEKGGGTSVGLAVIVSYERRVNARKFQDTNYWGLQKELVEQVETLRKVGKLAAQIP